MDGDDGYMALWMFQTALNCTLQKQLKIYQFYVVYFYYNKIVFNANCNTWELKQKFLRKYLGQHVIKNPLLSLG